jgi:transposase InsO family protein
MPIPTLANRPKPGWAVLLYGPPPEIQLLAGELDDSGLEIVRIGHHFFLQAPEVFNPLSTPDEVAWAAAAVLQQLNTAARLRYAVSLTIDAGSAILVNREGFWDQDEVDRAVPEVRRDGARPLQVSVGKIWTAARQRPHLARALDLFARGSAAWNLRQTFEEVVRELGPQWEAWIAARGRAAAEECAWFRATVFGSTPRRPGLSRRSGFPWPKNRTRAMPPLAAKIFVRSILEQLVLLRFKEGRS